MRRLLLTLILALVSATQLFATPTTPEGDPPRKVEITFTDHLAAGLIEQDVFVEKAGQRGVFRVVPDAKEASLDAPLYATARAVAHNPFDPKTIGSYPKGRATGMTLRDWLGAKGSATYACADGRGELDATFSGLVPKAVYTMWHFFMAMPPTDPFNGTLDLPLGARDGSQAGFRTDANGNARYRVTTETCLQLSDTQLAGGLAIAWHSDGKTYGPMPGPFGKATHVQLFAMLPADDAIAAR